MRVVEPGSYTLDSTTVAASALPEWSAGTAYTSGDTVSVSLESDGTTPRFPVREYRATGSSTGSYPPDAPVSEWVDIGAANQHRMFDGQNNTRTIAGSPITVMMSADSNVDCVAVLGLQDVATVRVLVETGTGATVADESVQLGSSSLDIGWYSYFFGVGTTRTKPSAVVYFPTTWAPTITITLTGEGSIGCAQTIIGASSSLGKTVQGPMPGFRSFSRKEFDADLGATQFVPRSNVRRADYQVAIETASFDGVFQLMESLIDKLALFDGNNAGTNYDALRTYGWVEDFQPELNDPGITYASLLIQGIS